MKIISFFKKNSDTIFYGVIVILIITTVLLIVLSNRCKGCREANVGVITATNPIPSSFNSKTEIKMEKTFYVVFGFPQLQTGDSLLARIDGKKIVSIKDDAGDWYDVLHETK